MPSLNLGFYGMLARMPIQHVLNYWIIFPLMVCACSDSNAIDVCNANSVPPNTICPGDYQWQRHISGSSVEVPQGIAVAPDGAVVITGSYNGTIDLGGGNPPITGLVGGFVARYTNDGSFEWNRAWGSTGSVSSGAVRTSSNGEVTVAGDFSGEIDLGGGMQTTTADFAAFVVRFDQAGNHMWERVINNSGSARVTSLAIDAGGEVAIVGSFVEDVDFGGGLRQPNGEDVFVVKLDSTGAFMWDYVAGDVGKDRPHDIAFGHDGGIVVVGSFSETTAFGGGVRPSAGSDDGFVVALDADGGYRWDATWGGADADGAVALATTNEGAIYTVGYFSATVDFGGGTRTSVTPSDGVLLAMFDDGRYNWDATFGGDSNVGSTAVGTTSGGDIVVAGGFRGTSDFGGGVRTSAGAGQLDGAFVVGYQTDGQYRWDRTWETNNATAWELSTGGGSIAVVGTFDGMANFGGGDIQNTDSNGTDTFIVVVWADYREP